VQSSGRPISNHLPAAGRPRHRNRRGRSARADLRGNLAFAQTGSAEYRRHFLTLPFPPETQARYRRLAEESLAEQRRIESEDTLPFEAFRQKYLSQDLLSGIRL